MNNRIDIDRLRELCAKNLNAVQIAARLGVTKNAVWDACKRHGITIVAAPSGMTGIYSASNV